MLIDKHQQIQISGNIRMIKKKIKNKKYVSL
jgi:hypothetical protein